MKIEPDEFFREVTLRISSSLDVNEAMDSLFEYMKAFFPLDAMFLNYRESDDGLYSISRVGDMPDILSKDMSAPILLIDRATQTLFEEEADRLNLRIGDVTLVNRPWPAFFQSYIARNKPELNEMPSAINLKLSIQGEDLGEFGMACYGENVFNYDHAHLLQTVKEPISIAMSNARRYRELLRLKDILADDNRSMRQELERISGNQVIGAEFGLRQTMEMVRQVAPLNNPILLLGETGTGKEVIANAIHLASPRRDKPMIRVQCGAIPDTLLDSELFGHEKGAFTGAIGLKRGRFERADGGTIFLDEIGELTMDAQVKLLRVLQEHEFERLGGTKTLQADVRVITATNRNLERMVREGRFREDLWYRLNVFPIVLPSLRERREDISSLTTYFINRKAREIGLPETPQLGPGALAELEAYNWPGNVRELQNVVERALIISNGRPLAFSHLVDAAASTSDDAPSFSSLSVMPNRQSVKPLNQVVAEHISLALKVARGQVEGKRGASAMLEVNPSTLRAKMRKLAIPFGRDVEDY